MSRGPRTRPRLAALAIGLTVGLATLGGCSEGSVEAGDPTGGDAGTPATSGGSGTPDDSGDPAAADRFAAQPADGILAAVQRDMAAVTTVQGRVVTTHRGLEVDATVALDAAGDCTGRLTLDGLTPIEVLRVDDAVYATFNAEVLQTLGHAEAGAASIADTVGDRWVLLDPDTGLTDVALVCGALSDTIAGSEVSVASLADVTVRERVDVDGVDSLHLTRAEEAGTTDLWVAVAGEHRYVRVSTPNGAATLTVDRLTYDDPVAIPAPGARGVVTSAAVGLG